MTQPTLPIELWAMVGYWVDDRRSFRSTCRGFRAIANDLVTHAIFGKRSGQHLSEAIARVLFALPHLTTVHLDVESGFGDLAKRQWHILSMSCDDLNMVNRTRSQDLTRAPRKTSNMMLFDEIFRGEPKKAPSVVRDDLEIGKLQLSGNFGNRKVMLKKNKYGSHTPRPTAKAYTMHLWTPYVSPEILTGLGLSSITTLLIDDPDFLETPNLFSTLGQMRHLHTLRVFDPPPYIDESVASIVMDGRLDEDRLTALAQSKTLHTLIVRASYSSMVGLDGVTSLQELRFEDIKPLDPDWGNDLFCLQGLPPDLKITLTNCAPSQHAFATLANFSQFNIL